MTQFLVPLDGSAYSEHALDYVIARAKQTPGETHVHVVNVQTPLSGVNVKMFVSTDSLQTYYREEGQKIVEPAVAKLKAKGLAATAHIGVGDAGKTVVDFATQVRAQEIVMGSHGRGALAGAFMGSVAQKVVHLASIPVVLVKSR
jgi:nucleotide-binding universal stress UspA family protein